MKHISSALHRDAIYADRYRSKQNNLASRKDRYRQYTWLDEGPTEHVAGRKPISIGAASFCARIIKRQG